MKKLFVVLVAAVLVTILWVTPWAYTARPVEVVDQQPLVSKDMEKISAWVRSKNPRLTQADIASIVHASMSASQKFFVDPLLLLGIMQQESRFRPQVRSGYGAVGLMQVVPRFHASKFSGEKPDDIQANVNAGAWVLRDCQKKHKHDMRRSLACYSGYSAAEVTDYKNNVLLFRADLLNAINKERV